MRPNHHAQDNALDRQPSQQDTALSCNPQAIPSIAPDCEEEHKQAQKAVHDQKKQARNQEGMEGGVLKGALRHLPRLSLGVSQHGDRAHKRGDGEEGEQKNCREPGKLHCGSRKNMLRSHPVFYAQKIDRKEPQPASRPALRCCNPLAGRFDVVFTASFRLCGNGGALRSPSRSGRHRASRTCQAPRQNRRRSPGIRR